MLQKLNERIQGIIAWVIIVVIALTFSLFGIDYYLQTRQHSTVQVEVNGRPITKQSFELAYRRHRQAQDLSQMTSAFESQLKNQILEEMILNQVSLQAAEKNGFSISLEQANEAILGIPQFQEDGHFSTARYQQALSGALFTPDAFQREVRQGMLLNQQRFALIGTSFALPNEVKKFVQLSTQTRDYRYLQIPMQSFVGQVTVTPAEIKAYYQQHQSEFLAPEKVSLDYVRLSMQDMKKKIAVTADQIKRYYEENQSNYFIPAKWRVAHLLFLVPEAASESEQQKIKEQAEEVSRTLKQNPDQFEAQVKALSADKISAQNGGVLPWMMAGQTEFDQTLVTLTRPGDISSPAKGRHGYEIFKLIEFQPASLKPFSEVRGEIRAQLLAERAQADYAKALEQLSDLSYQSPDSLTPVSDLLNLKIKRTGLFSQAGGAGLLTKNKQVVQAAFSHDVLTLGNNSEPIQLNNDGVVVVRVNQHIPATHKKLDEVHSEIAQRLTEQKAQAQAKKLGQTFLSSRGNPGEREKLMLQSRLKWHSVKQVLRETEDVPTPINALAFSLARAGTEQGRVLDNGDFLILQLTAVHDGHMKALDQEQIANITQQLEANYGVVDYDLYLSGLLKQAKIVRF